VDSDQSIVNKELSVYDLLGAEALLLDARVQPDFVLHGECLGFRVSDFGFKVYGSCFGVWGRVFRDLDARVQPGCVLRDECSGFRVSDSRGRGIWFGGWG
jgi:hypothetical protein